MTHRHTLLIKSSINSTHLPKRRAEDHKKKEENPKKIISAHSPQGLITFATTSAGARRCPWALSLGEAHPSWIISLAELFRGSASCVTPLFSLSFSLASFRLRTMGVRGGPSKRDRESPPCRPESIPRVCLSGRGQFASSSFFFLSLLSPAEMAVLRFQ